MADNKKDLISGQMNVLLEGNINGEWKMSIVDTINKE